MISQDVLTGAIALGASLSAEVELGGRELVAIQMPSVWTAAVITFTSGPTSGALGPVKLDDGTELQLTVTASDYVILDPLTSRGFGRYLQVRSGTSGAAVNQAAARSLTLVTRP